MTMRRMLRNIPRRGGYRGNGGGGGGYNRGNFRFGMVMVPLVATVATVGSLGALTYYYLHMSNFSVKDAFHELNWIIEHPEIRASKSLDTPILDPDYRPQARFARNIVKRHLSTHAYPGATVAVVKDGRLVWAEGFGYSDVENLVPVSHKTVFRVASISKALTAMCALKMWENDQLDIDKDVREYLPDLKLYFRPPGAQEKEVLPMDQKVTTRMLLSHLSGIRHYKEYAEYSQTKHYENVEQALEMFINDELQHMPGEKYLYSTFGLVLASVVMQKAGGMPFPQLMTQTLFNPLDMKSTREESHDVLVPRRGRHYIRVFDKSNSPKESYKSLASSHLENAPYVDNSNKFAGGGFMSTAKDIAKFGYQTICGDFLSKQTQKMMLTPQKQNDGTATPYGIGWSLPVREDIDLERMSGRFCAKHSGGASGGTSMLYVLPEQKIAVAVIVNLQGVNRIAELAEKIAMQFESFDEKAKLPYAAKDDKV
uniref:Beta-lactamase-related domain-containing protein n=1 Tax=Percolomonas cosmopolitus TaxID=63605 RepID=A0A7S1KTU5_9EUKA|mmetsp:Transcript_8137/g.30136  ORF Transcript_8137/g.30136 Transcript_8137/m.30136 type:complete len:483 (+) Transcript_8137:1714-3162(+)